MKKSILNITPMGFPWQTKDPFLFCAHHADFYPKGNENLGPDPATLKGRNIGQDFTLKDGWRMYHGDTIPGFPSHPHRGFETITVAKTGLVDHSDSMGAAGRFGNGDVQWMTAGKGVQHSEMFPLLNENEDNPLEIFQVWLNLPRSKKMVEPHFKMLWHEDIPVITEDEWKVNIIAGNFRETKALRPAPDSWAEDINNHVAVWTIELEPNGTITLPAASAEANRTIYFYEGNSIEIDSTEIHRYHAVELKPDEHTSIKNGSEKGYFLLLQGKPLNEPVAQYGPFVMNTQQEIQQAFLDYQKDHFGGWPWKRLDNVHDRSKRRFALHADGRLEEKE